MNIKTVHPDGKRSFDCERTCSAGPGPPGHRLPELRLCQRASHRRIECRREGKDVH